MYSDSRAQSGRILLIRNAQPYDFGGGERFPVDLAVILRSHNIRPVIVSRSPRLLEYARSHDLETIRGWWWQRQNWSGAHILLTPVYFVWQLLLTAWYVRLILRHGAEMVHPQSKDDFIAATLAATLTGRRVIWTDHADLKYVYANHTVWYKNPIGKLVAALSRRADAVTLVSHSEETLVTAALGHTLPGNYRVIHNGVNDRTVTPLERDEADREAYIYCATSRLVAAKGILELIEAFDRLHQTYPDSRLLLVGDGPDAETFRQTAQALDNPDICFYGHSDEPLPLLAASDVFVHPSHHEGFSLSLVEASMLGKPIIACDVGGNPEIIIDGQTGLLTPAQDADNLFTAMKRLYEDRALAQKLGRQARDQYEEKFQFDSIVAEHFLPLYSPVRKSS